MIFLTGGTGLVGLHVIDELKEEGHPVVALARSEAAAATLRARGAESILGDATDPASWNRLPACEAIVHAAAMIMSGGPWAEFERVNVGSTRLAVEAALRLGVPLIHISSVSVYEDAASRPPGTATEDLPIGPRDRGEFYARSKRLSEDVVWEGVSRGLRAVALRPCVIYGAGDRLFLPNVIRQARLGFFPVIGKGEGALAIVEARNVARAVSAALRAPPDAFGRPYNITNDDAISVRDFVAALARGLGRRVRALHAPRGPMRGVALVADWFRGLGGGGAPGLKAAVRFLEGGNPYTSAAARERLGWRPAGHHQDLLPHAIQAILTAAR